MKIAFLLPCLKFGGAERVTLTMSRSLRKRGHDVSILVMQCIGELVPEAYSTCHVVDLACDRTYKLPGALLRYAEANAPDVILSSFWKLNICACLSMIAYPRTKLFVWEHNTFSKATRLSKFLYFVSSTVLYRRARHIICVSEGVANDVERLSLFLSGRITVLLNPIEVPCVEPYSTLTRKLPFQKLEVVFVGRLAPQKNLSLLFEAVSLVKIQKPIRLTVVGDGPEGDFLSTLAAKLSLETCVEFTGYVTNPSKFILRAHLLALSSNDEGLPSVIVQALQLGVPVVSTRSSSGVDLILKGGRFGRIVPKGDAHAFAQAILDEADSPTSLLGVEEHLRAFDPDIATEQFLRVFEHDSD